MDHFPYSSSVAIARDFGIRRAAALQHFLDEVARPEWNDHDDRMLAYAHQFIEASAHILTRGEGVSVGVKARCDLPPCTVIELLIGKLSRLMVVVGASRTRVWRIPTIAEIPPVYLHVPYGSTISSAYIRDFKSYVKVDDNVLQAIPPNEPPMDRPRPPVNVFFVPCTFQGVPRIAVMTGLSTVKKGTELCTAYKADHGIRKCRTVSTINDELRWLRKHYGQELENLTDPVILRLVDEIMVLRHIKRNKGNEKDDADDDEVEEDDEEEEISDDSAPIAEKVKKRHQKRRRDSTDTTLDPLPKRARMDEAAAQSDETESIVTVSRTPLRLHADEEALEAEIIHLELVYESPPTPMTMPTEPVTEEPVPSPPRLPAPLIETPPFPPWPVTPLMSLPSPPALPVARINDYDEARRAMIKRLVDHDLPESTAERVVNEIGIVNPGMLRVLPRLPMWSTFKPAEQFILQEDMNA